jgi:cytidine deaminase
MVKMDIVISYKIYDQPGELAEEDRTLLEEAVKSLKKSYAPYSAFHVGASVLLANGEIIVGNNQENVAYPSGLCAERVALFYASSQFPNTPVKAIAITARSRDFLVDEPVTPCGSCRQVMAETENRNHMKMKVIMRGETGKIYVVEGIQSILPLMFHAEKLKK